MSANLLKVLLKNQATFSAKLTEEQITQLKQKLSNSGAPGMQFNRDPPHPPEAIPEYPRYSPGIHERRTRGGRTIFHQRHELQ